ncbi:MAG: VanZ family protein [Gammaproteobacteria bacterium]
MFIFINRPIHRGVGIFLLFAVLAGSITSNPIPSPHDVSHADKVIHALAYTVLGLWFGQLRSSSQQISLLLLLTLFGSGIEIIQHFLPYRTASFMDMLANTVGGLFAALICVFMSKSRRKR